MARNQQEIIDMFRAAVREVENKDLGQLQPTTNLADLGLDSVATMEVIGVLEERLKVQFPDEDLANLNSIGDLTALVSRLA